MSLPPRHRVTCFPVSYRRDVQALAEMQIIVLSRHIWEVQHWGTLQHDLAGYIFVNRSNSCSTLYGTNKTLYIVHILQPLRCYSNFIVCNLSLVDPAVAVDVDICQNLLCSKFE